MAKDTNNQNVPDAILVAEEMFGAIVEYELTDIRKISDGVYYGQCNGIPYIVDLENYTIHGGAVFHKTPIEAYDIGEGWQ